MDILRKELNAIYASQRLCEEALDTARIDESLGLVSGMSEITGTCAVVTDAAADRCWIFPGELATTGGFAPGEVASSDEDAIYSALHPEDLVEKRMLEYEFFKLICSLPPERMLTVRATCTLRMHDTSGQYRLIDNSTRVLRLSPAGKMWLILCCYNLSPRDGCTDDGICPRIIDAVSGDVTPLSFSGRRERILTPREKEILSLVRDGLPSKLIADLLNISLHTVSRHRQNILEKLSVGNSLEAIAAALSMKLI